MSSRAACIIPWVVVGATGELSVTGFGIVRVHRIGTHIEQVCGRDVGNAAIAVSAMRKFVIICETFLAGATADTKDYGIVGTQLGTQGFYTVRRKQIDCLPRYRQCRNACNFKLFDNVRTNDSLRLR